MPGPVIVRLPNWLGDTVMAVPAIRSLRAAAPDARLAVAGPWASILADQGLADVCVVYPRSWAGRLRRVDTLRDLRPETGVLLPNSLEAALAACYWGARRRIGFAVAGRSPLLTDPIALPSPRRHQVDEYLLLVEALGARAGDRVPRLLPPMPDGPERTAARALLAEAAESAGPRVAVHLDAAWGPAKLWPVERVAEFCRLVVADGAIPVFLGPPDAASAAAAIGARCRAASLVGRDHPGLLAAILSEVDALVCGDTGVGHLAAALGIPVVALFGPTDARLTAPRGETAVARHSVPCAPCFYRACPIEHPCMDGIAPGEVRDRLRALLEARGAAAAAGRGAPCDP